MPAATKKRPPMELEPGEGKAHEMGETPAEETREGAEPDDAPKVKTNRKRSAKGAKHTKAAKDGDCGCSGRKGKGTCDGNCGGYAKKMDALTPQEYLAACELGIQNRSRPYIRSRLDKAERLDLKCGRGSISEGEKCTKGTAQKVDPVQANGSTKGAGNKIKVAGEIAARLGGGVVAGLGVMQMSKGVLSGDVSKISKGYRNLTLGSAAMQTAAASKAGRMGKKELSSQLLQNAGTNAAIGVGQEAALRTRAGIKRQGAIRQIQRRQSLEQLYRGPSAKRDSIYAPGFSPDLDQLAI